MTLLLNAALGGSFGLSDIRQSMQAVLGLGSLLSVGAATVGLLPRRRAAAPWMLALLTVALSIVASLAVLRDAPTVSPEAEVQAYLETAGTLEADGSRLVTTFTAITADMTSTGEANARRIRAQVLPLVDEMQADAAAQQPLDPTLRTAHALVVESLDTAERGFVAMAEALDAYDTVRYERGFALWIEANETWAKWRTAVGEAAASAGISLDSGASVR